MGIKRLVRTIANTFGVDLVWRHQSPRLTLLGLRGRDIRTVIDVGANEGQFARAISAFFPQASIYCFEPLETPFRQLSDWAATQEGRVRCFNVALGDTEGEVQMHRHDGHTASSSLLATTAHCHDIYPQTALESIASVKLTTLDRALADSAAGMAGDILLKLDVQGFEDRVLRGGTKVLAQCSACILEVCLDSLYEGQADFFELVSLMQNAGFRYAGNLDQQYVDTGRVAFCDMLFVRS